MGGYKRTQIDNMAGRSQFIFNSHIKQHSQWHKKSISKENLGRFVIFKGPTVFNSCSFAADKPFKDVKVGELSQWIRRRNIGVFGTISMVTRGECINSNFSNKPYFVRKLMSFKVELIMHLSSVCNEIWRIWNLMSTVYAILHHR